MRILSLLGTLVCVALVSSSVEALADGFSNPNLFLGATVKCTRKDVSKTKQFQFLFVVPVDGDANLNGGKDIASYVVLVTPRFSVDPNTVTGPDIQILGGFLISPSGDGTSLTVAGRNGKNFTNLSFAANQPLQTAVTNGPQTLTLTADPEPSIAYNCYL